jgi:hypothetical protein
VDVMGVFWLWHEGMLVTDWRQSGPGISRNRAKGWVLEVTWSQELAASYAAGLPFGHKLPYSQRYSPAQLKSQPPGLHCNRAGGYIDCVQQVTRITQGLF